MPANMASTAPTQTMLSTTLTAASSAATNGTPAAAGSSSSSNSPATPVPHIRIVPHLDAPRSLHFEVVDKDVPEGFVLKIGRFTDKQNLPNRITFRSKVVSRGHAEIFTEMGKFYLRDTKSSSGTFLNHARLSPPGCESKPTLLKDGDVVQLGVDYQGGTQEIYRCVKMRLEINRGWQQQANPFRANTLKAIKSLTTQSASSATDCCICLFRIASFQSLFVAPCSHIFHYKCIRPMLVANHPGFLCPLCRTFADLEDSVEIDDPTEEEQAVENAIEASKNEPQPAETTSEATQQTTQGNVATDAAMASSSSASAQPQDQDDSSQERLPPPQQHQQQELAMSLEQQGSSSATSAPVPVNGRSGNISAIASRDAALAPPLSPGLNDISAPTPPSDLAHTFQPLQRPASATSNGSSGGGAAAPRDGEFERVEGDDGHRHQQAPRSRHSTITPGITTANDHEGAGSSTLAPSIQAYVDGSLSSSPRATTPTSTTMPTSTVVVPTSQPVPSPARPRSSSSSLLTGSARQGQQHSRTRSPSMSSPSHHQHSSSSTSASSPSSSNFLSSFMRSMTMPRSRSRTNSASHLQAPAPPPPAPPQAVAGGGGGQGPVSNTGATGGSHPHLSSGANSSGNGGGGGGGPSAATTTTTGDLHHDVYGKTLVVTPPPMLAGPMRLHFPNGGTAGSTTATAATTGGQMLGAVTEVDGESMVVEERELPTMQEEAEEVEEGQGQDEEGRAASSVDDGASSSSDGDVLMFSVDGAAGSTTAAHGASQGNNLTSSNGSMGCEVVVGNAGADGFQRAPETTTA